MLVPTINAKAEIIDYSEGFDFYRTATGYHSCELLENGFKISATNTLNREQISMLSNNTALVNSTFIGKKALLSFDFETTSANAAISFSLDYLDTNNSIRNKLLNQTTITESTFSQFLDISNIESYYDHFGLRFYTEFDKTGNSFEITNFKLIIGDTEEEILEYLSSGTEESSEESSEEESSSDIVIHDSTLNVILYALVFMFDLVIVLVLLRGVL